MPLLGYIGRQFSTVRIVVLTMLENPALVKRLREVGVNAVISKADDLSHIGLAVVQVMRGKEYIGPSVQKALDSMGLSASGAAAGRGFVETRAGSGAAFRFRHDDY